MPVKDYYKMLELNPGASEKEIRRSFRRLALRYHPDTNQQNQHAEAWFRELQEAYDTLTDPAKKEAYLQKRWLAQSQGKAMQRPAPLVPEVILAEARELAEHSSRLDHFRMNHEQLAESLSHLLNEERMQVLLNLGDAKTNGEVVNYLLYASSPVEYKWLPDFFQRLQKLTTANKQLYQLVLATEKKRRLDQWWARHQWWVMLLATLLLCAGIYFFAHAK